MANVVRVVGGAVTREGTWLAAQRSATMAEPLAWEFPGGKVEPGESDEGALVRELYEELGVDVVTGPRIGSSSVTRGDRVIELIVYEAYLARGEPFATEHAALGWFEPAELRALDWAEADIPIVGALLTKLASQG